MSWPLALSQYPRSVLGENLPLIVLVFLEKNGLATEDELAAHLCLGNHEVATVLFDLRLDDFVTFGRQSVRPTEKGKHLIDRFSLSGAIIDDLLDDLCITGEERTSYHTAVSAYRDRAFDQYLNSLCTIRVWRSVADSIAGSAEGRSVEDAKHSGALTFLLRDLRNWHQHQHPSADLFSRFPPKTKRVLTGKRVPPPKQNQRVPENLALAWLAAILHDIGHCPHSQMEVDRDLWNGLLTLDAFQKRAQRNTWFEEWSMTRAGTQTASSESSAPRSHVTFQFPKAERSLQVAEFPPGISGSSSWWGSDPLGDMESVLLPSLMAASSLEALAQTTGLCQDAVRHLVQSVHDKSEDLLAGQRPGNE